MGLVMKSDSKSQRRFERDLERKVKLVNKTLERILSRRDLISKELRVAGSLCSHGAGQAHQVGDSVVVLRNDKREG